MNSSGTYTSVKKFMIENNFISVVNKVKTDANGSPFVTFNGFDNYSENVYFCEPMNSLVKEGDSVDKNLFANLFVYEYLSDDGEYWLKYLSKQEIKTDDVVNLESLENDIDSLEIDKEEEKGVNSSKLKPKEDSTNHNVKSIIMDEIENKKKYSNVGGWLSLLCFMLILGSPIRNIFTIYTEYTGTSIYFKEIKGLENFIYMESITIIILMILSIWSGISLLLIKPYAVKITKIYLTLFLINGLVQNFFPEIAGLDAEFIKGMEYDMEVNTTSAILVFGIWFTYLSVSERVKNTYPNSKPIENQKYIDFASKLNSQISKIKNFYNNQVLVRIKKLVINNLNSDEIIIASIVLATLIALILGYNFGETYYFESDGDRGNQEYHSYTEFHFNYLLGIASFIIFGGVSYIYLNRKNKNNE